MPAGTLYRLAAFAGASGGGNPAGVWLGDALPDATQMQNIAADVGFSETAFVAPATGVNREVRYFSPEAEVSFCGHATIASGVVIGRISGEGTYQLTTAAGTVPVTARSSGGEWRASLTSVEPMHELATPALLRESLAALRWQPDELDPSIAPAKAYAGAWHLVLAASSKARLAELDYDFERLKKLMRLENLTTLQLVWRECDDVVHARNPFPVGGVVEDPATGAAAAAFGGYLRDAGLIDAPHRLTIRQGEVMGSPSVLIVDVPETGGIVVSGSAIDI